ncbi:hypothetical protein SCHPADRAFT_898047 [Schizopora paradoxa]|uniref:Actin cortical patch SUR7/pH-response regulator PalI n=1 Tax=Schizopora paradoxa TaxID=27342 RepID=A0A0H2S6Y8_9AGAM|nr:hypothetical protein SCHPADRAFT_898047 [Schizopora paradoxa]
MVRLRGEICIGMATFLSFTSVVLLIFAHVGQINTSTVPRGIAMMKVNMSNYGAALANAIGDPVQGLYTSNASAPTGQEAGLRQLYQFGLYSYCAYIDHSQGTCTNTSAAFQLQPFKAVLSDMPANYSGLTQGFVPDTLTLTNDHYLGEFSKAAYYLLLIGTICAFLAMVIGVPKRTLTYLISTLFAIFGTGLLFIGVVIWTVLIHKAETINKAQVSSSGAGAATLPLGIVVSVGSGLWLFWAAFVCLFLSVVPYLVSCCTYRG